MIVVFINCNKTIAYGENNIPFQPHAAQDRRAVIRDLTEKVSSNPKSCTQADRTDPHRRNNIWSKKMTAVLTFNCKIHRLNEPHPTVVNSTIGHKLVSENPNHIFTEIKDKLENMDI